MEPFRIQIDLRSGVFRPDGRPTQRRLSDMRHAFADTEAVSRLMAAEGDRLIYEFYAADVPEEAGQVFYGTTIIYPGRVGNEFHMTKGHFHRQRDRAEVYLGLAGDGYLVLQTEDGAVRGVPMNAGTVAYVPPMWAHRTANVGDTPFVFFAAWPGDAGHDYGTIEETGFARLLVEQNGQAILIDNPRYGHR